MRIVPCRNVEELLGKNNAFRQVQRVVPAKSRADQILILICGGIEKGLPLILHCCFDVEFLHWRLDHGVADSTAVDLLQVEALAEIVIKGYLTEEVKPGRNILVPLRIGVEDGSLCDVRRNEIAVRIRI